MSVKQAKVTFFFFFFFFFFTLFLIFRPTDISKDLLFWLSIVVGGGLGIISCVFANIKWRPTIDTNTDAYTDALTASRLKWMPIIVILGLISGKVVISIFDPKIELIITNFVLSWLIVILFYLVVKK